MGHNFTTKTVSKSVSKGSSRTPFLQSPQRSISVTSNQSLGSGLTKNPSILPFLKPTGALSKIRQSESGQNEILPKPKVALASPLQSLEGPSGSQKLVSDFFPKK